MAVLSDDDRKAIWAEFMRDESSSRTATTLSKSALRSAVDSVDEWINTNAAAFLASFPEPAASALTNIQKARLFFAVAERRWEVI